MEIRKGLLVNTAIGLAAVGMERVVPLGDGGPAIPGVPTKKPAYLNSATSVVSSIEIGAHDSAHGSPPWRTE